MLLKLHHLKIRDQKLTSADYKLITDQCLSSVKPVNRGVAATDEFVDLGAFHDAVGYAEEPELNYLTAGSFKIICKNL